MQVELAVKILPTLTDAAGLTTAQAIAGLLDHDSFARLSRSTLRWYVHQAFKQLAATGDYEVKKGKTNRLISYKALIISYATEMRREGFSRKYIVQILSEDFGLTKGRVTQYLKGTN